MHIIIDILHSFNLRNCSCFRFWVFCLVFCLRNPRRGFFSPFPARYAHILLHFYDLVSGSGFSAGFSVSRTQLVGFSARFPLATPTSCQLTTQKRQESPSCRFLHLSYLITSSSLVTFFTSSILNAFNTGLSISIRERIR